MTSETTVSAACGWTVGPVWKDGGDFCRCILPPDHHGTPYPNDIEAHVCDCGAWFARCGRPESQFVSEPTDS